MAEGFAKRLLPADWQIHSAGIRADGLNPIAVRVMAEIGFDISDQTSTVLDPKALQSSDLIVTLCGDARDHCPVTPARVQKQHWPLLDPAQAPVVKLKFSMLFARFATPSRPGSLNSLNRR